METEWYESKALLQEMMCQAISLAEIRNNKALLRTSGHKLNLDTGYKSQVKQRDNAKEGEECKPYSCPPYARINRLLTLFYKKWPQSKSWINSNRKVATTYLLGIARPAHSDKLKMQSSVLDSNSKSKEKRISKLFSTASWTSCKWVICEIQWQIKSLHQKKWPMTDWSISTPFVHWNWSQQISTT